MLNIISGNCTENSLPFERIDTRSSEKAFWLYKHIVKKEISTTSSCVTTELAKTIENSYRDINIVFANEIALVSESMGVNIFEVIDLINALHDCHDWLMLIRDLE